MRVVRPSSEDEMVATFLAGELGSERFGATLAGALEGAGGTRAPADAARRIVAGIDVFGVSSRGFLDAAAAYVPADAPS